MRAGFLLLLLLLLHGKFHPDLRLLRRSGSLLRAVGGWLVGALA